MAITRAQEARQLRRRGGIMGSNAGSMLVTPTLDGSRPGYYGPDAGFATEDDNYKQSAVDYGGVEGISDRDAERVFDARPDLKEAYDNADKEYEKRKKEKEKADKERRERERREARKERREERKKLTKAEKKKKRMQKAAFERFQKLEDYVDPFGDYTTFADMTGEEAAELAGYNVSEIPDGPPNRTTFEYDKDRFRDPKTGKFKKGLTEIVNINEGKKNIFGRPKKAKFVEQIKPDAIPGYDFSINPVRSNFESGLGTLTSTGGVRPNDYGLGTDAPGFLGLAQQIVRPETGLQAFNTLEEARNIQDLTTRFAGGDDSAYQEFEDYVNRNKPPVAGGGGDPTRLDPCKGPNPPAYCFIDPPTDPTDPSTPSTGVFAGIAPRFAGSIFDFDALRAGAMDGGIMNSKVMGGMADGNIDEAGRQMYFLGKLVKKATRAVKKVAKSPFGKSALLGLGAYYMPGFVIKSTG